MFEHLLNQRLTILKEGGAQISNVKASVQELIFVRDISLIIEEGDIVEYVMPSGVLKRLLITKVTLYNIGSPMDHYELEFQVA